MTPALLSPLTEADGECGLVTRPSSRSARSRRCLPPSSLRHGRGEAARPFFPASSRDAPSKCSMTTAHELPACWPLGRQLATWSTPASWRVRCGAGIWSSPQIPVTWGQLPTLPARHSRWSSPDCSGRCDLRYRSLVLPIRSQGLPNVDIGADRPVVPRRRRWTRHLRRQWPGRSTNQNECVDLVRPEIKDVVAYWPSNPTGLRTDPTGPRR